MLFAFVTHLALTKKAIDGGRFAGLFCNSLSTFKPHEKTAKTRKATKLTGPGIDENEEHDGAEDIFI